LFDAGFDVDRSASAVDDDGVFFAHFDALGLIQIVDADPIKTRWSVFGQRQQIQHFLQFFLKFCTAFQSPGAQGRHKGCDATV
jgi:hypothetical protein